MQEAATVSPNAMKADASPAPPSPFKLLWPAYFCVMIDFMGLGIAFPITPTVVAQLGGTAKDVSMTLGCFNAAQFVGKRRHGQGVR